MPAINWEAISGICAAAAFLVTLWTRAAVAELRADLAERQEKRCKECHMERAVTQTAVAHLQGELHRG